MTDWSRLFGAPIPLPDGRALTKLEDAGRYVAAFQRPNRRSRIGRLPRASC
jgi:hypothetical protein